MRAAPKACSTTFVGVTALRDGGLAAVGHASGPCTIDHSPQGASIDLALGGYGFLEVLTASGDVTQLKFSSKPGVSYQGVAKTGQDLVVSSFHGEAGGYQYSSDFEVSSPTSQGSKVLLRMDREGHVSEGLSIDQTLSTFLDLRVLTTSPNGSIFVAGDVYGPDSLKVSETVSLSGPIRSTPFILGMDPAALRPHRLVHNDSTRLMSLYTSAGGDNWYRHDNWGTSEPLSTWYGVTTDSTGTRVVGLDLSDNNLVGNIDSEVVDLERLRSLRLSRNSLEGETPYSLGRLTNLEVLAVDHNQLAGPILSEAAKLGKLIDFDCSYNLFGGTVPENLASIPAFTAQGGTFDLSHNYLTGTTPQSILDCPNWKYLCNVLVLQQEPRAGLRFPTEETVDFSQDHRVRVLQQSSHAKSIGIYLLGDGFIDKDMGPGGAYESTLMKVYDHLFDCEPLRSYRDYFTVYLVQVVSMERSAPPGFPINKTALSLNAKSIFHMSTVDHEAVRHYVLNAPGGLGETVTVLVPNYSPLYSFRESCAWDWNSYLNVFYSYAQLVPNAAPYIFGEPYVEDFSATVAHEVIGHGIGLLCDEYVENAGTIDSTSMAQMDLMHSHKAWANIDRTSDPETIQWSSILKDPRYRAETGIFEGGDLFSRGVWRPSEISLMSCDTDTFNAPSRAAIVRRAQEVAGEVFDWEEFVRKDKAAFPAGSPAKPMKRRFSLQTGGLQGSDTELVERSP